MAIHTLERLKAWFGKVSAPRASEAPGDADQYYHEGTALLAQQENEAALAAFRKAHQCAPERTDILYSVGFTLYQLRRYPEARRMLEQCLTCDANYADALNVMGCICQMTGNIDEAITYYEKTLALRPDSVLAIGNIPCALAEAKRYGEAIAGYEKALAAHPDSAAFMMDLMQWRRRTCSWEGLGDLEKRMGERIMRHNDCVTPFNITTYFESPNLQLANAARWSLEHYPEFTLYDPQRPLPSDERGDGRLRIGYLSGDFNDHATSYLICELFEQYDKERFEIYAYSTGAVDESESSRRMRKPFKVFRDITDLSDSAAAQQIRKDGIDIMVDLKGYTKDHRMDVLALRPAPLQMHYLGYPGTTGAPFMDYFLSDTVASPPDTDHYFSEKLIRLPHCYQVNDRKRFLPKSPGKRANYGLPDGMFVFCAFNGEVKNTPAMFDVWMRLLKQVEDSVLWIYSSLPESEDNLKREAEARGVDPSRLIIAPSMPHGKHLPRYLLADLFLDTYPLSGHTTISDVLWMGVPLVTLAGESFCSRVATSLLHAVGLPEWSATSFGEYEQKALSLARDPEKLLAVRRYLEEGRMKFPLFNSGATIRAIEAAYLHAASLYRQCKPLTPFHISGDNKVATN